MIAHGRIHYVSQDVTIGCNNNIDIAKRAIFDLISFYIAQPEAFSLQINIITCFPDTKGVGERGRGGRRRH